MKPLRPAMTLPGGFTDPNQGGGPGSATGGASIGQRGSFGSAPRKPARPTGRTKPSRGNPAHRGATPVHFQPHTRNPGHGGSVQTSPRLVNHQQDGGFGDDGQAGVPSYPHGNPSLGAGNVSGQASRMISGNFKRKAMKTYGGPPVSLDT